MLNVFIVNPMAGKSYNRAELEKEIKAAFVGREEEMRIEYTQRAGHAREIARSYAETGERVRLYPCGGDGTLFEVVNGVFGYDNAEVAPVPRGSGNDFVKLYDRNRRPTVEDMVNGEVYAADLIKCDGEVAINCFSAGLDAEVAGLISKLKKLPLVSGSFAYGIAAAAKLIQNKKYKLTLVIDGEDCGEEKLMFAAAMNGRFYGGEFNPTPQAKIDDGLFDLVRVKAMSYISIAGLVGKYKKGTHLPDKKGRITLVRCKKIRVISQKPILITLDGEMRTKNDVEIEILPCAANVVFPQWVENKENLLTNCKKERAPY